MESFTMAAAAQLRTDITSKSLQTPTPRRMASISCTILSLTLDMYAVHASTAWQAYLLSQRNPSNPVDEYQFGMSGPAGNETFTGTVPVGPQGNETALGANFAVWMLSGLTPMPDGKTILGVFPALNEGTSTNLYSTMVQMEVVDPSTVPAGGNPPTTRLGTGRLFYPAEVQYGTFGLVAGIDGYLYLFGADNTGIKLARVPNAGNTTIADRNQYSYYNSATGAWTLKQPLKLNDPTGNILTWSYQDFANQTIGPNVGDIWYDSYHQTTVMTFGDTWVDGSFWFSYATTNNLEGPWSTPQSVWTPPVPSQCSSSSEDWNYQAHAHPGWDTTGKTLLVSYASCATYVSMALITWA
jgi:hypothetical protein